jgi:DNA-binding PadR family transcriptional regulator
MPSRPSHLPHNLQRSALQKMITTQGLSSAQLYPAGKQTVAGMVANGWIEMQMDANGGARYRITPDGEAALKAKIPSSGR